MNDLKNILIFPAGTEIGLEVYQALKNSKELQLFGAGALVSSHAPFIFENYFTLPHVSEDKWLSAIVELCLEKKIDYIFPAHDDAITALVLNRSAIPSVVVAPSLNICQITRSKRATYKSLKGLIKVPRIFDQTPSECDYPVFVKPNIGQGSQGAKIINNCEELRFATANLLDPLVCEYLPGDEYTIDCFSDRKKGLLFSEARVRTRKRNGIAVGTSSVDLPDARDMAASIQDKLGLYGPWFFQVKRNAQEELVLLEVAPRIAGSMGLHRVMGVNFPQLAIYEAEGKDLSLIVNKGSVRLDRALSNRYQHDVSFTDLYIDLDDTIIIRESINTEAINLIYRCINKKIKVHLLTRHSGDLAKTLLKFRLQGLFDSIQHIDLTAKKSDYILGVAPIFLDDSFSERLDVHKSLNIPTYDCSMIEILINSI